MDLVSTDRCTLVCTHNNWKLQREVWCKRLGKELSHKGGVQSGFSMILCDQLITALSGPGNHNHGAHCTHFVEGIKDAFHSVPML